MDLDQPLYDSPDESQCVALGVAPFERLDFYPTSPKVSSSTFSVCRPSETPASSLYDIFSLSLLSSTPKRTLSSHWGTKKCIDFPLPLKSNGIYSPEPSPPPNPINRTLLAFFSSPEPQSSVFLDRSRSPISMKKKAFGRKRPSRIVSTILTNENSLLNYVCTKEPTPQQEVYPLSLPIIETCFKDAIPRISCETFNLILQGNINAKFSSIFIIDARFWYEYQGGHIPTALNCSSPSDIDELFFKPEIISEFRSKTCLIIFHCEFSSHRAPALASYMRKKDRSLNRYPTLIFPELYILHGGYCEFFQKYSSAYDQNTTFKNFDISVDQGSTLFLSHRQNLPLESTHTSQNHHPTEHSNFYTAVPNNKPKLHLTYVSMNDPLYKADFKVLRKTFCSRKKSKICNFKINSSSEYNSGSDFCAEECVLSIDDSFMDL